LKDGIGRGDPDRPSASGEPAVRSYSHVKDVRNLASVIGEEELTSLDHQYLEFGKSSSDSS
jgi:V/A-type H+-transporting ATPase subunit B